MSEETDEAVDDGGDAGWFAGLDPEDVEAAARAIAEGGAEAPADWPRRAVESGFAETADGYYERLHEATTLATRRAVWEREGADDRQLIHAVRAMDDCRRVANELSERAVEWAGSRREAAGSDLSYVRRLAAESDGDRATEVGRPAEGDGAPEGGGADGADGAPEGGGDGEVDGARDPGLDDERLVSLARRVRDLDDEATALRTHVERTAPEVAPNLAALAGPVLAARLIALAGDLETLARKPAGTVQVLGAEEALFAHLRGRAPSPKHGVIYVHEAVRGTHPAHRGSAARALAGKLAIAARVDHYSGDRKPELDAELADRIERIQARDAP